MFRVRRVFDLTSGVHDRDHSGTFIQFCQDVLVQTSETVLVLSEIRLIVQSTHNLANLLAKALFIFCVLSTRNENYWRHRENNPNMRGTQESAGTGTDTVKRGLASSRLCISDFFGTKSLKYAGESNLHARTLRNVAYLPGPGLFN